MISSGSLFEATTACSKTENRHDGEEDDFLKELNEVLLMNTGQLENMENDENNDIITLSEMKNMSLPSSSLAMIEELESYSNSNTKNTNINHHDDMHSEPNHSHLNTNNNTPQRKSHRNSFECVLCSSTFHKKSQLRAHILEKHSAVLEQENHDEEKGEGISVENLREFNPDDHQQHHHYHLMEEEGFTIDSPFLELSDLDEFNSVFSDFQSEELKKENNINNINGITEQLEDSSLAQTLSSEEPVVISLYKCTHSSCGKEFTSKGKLDKHLKKHEEKRHLCGFPSCGKTFSFRHELLEHIKTKHSPKQSVCTICNKEFKDLQALQAHLRTIHKNEKKVFRCHFEDCNKCYTNKRNLDDHIKTTHLKTKQFKCDICQRVLKHKASLRRHYKNVHNQVYVDPVSTPLTSEGEVSDSIFTEVITQSTNANENEFSIPHSTKETSKKKRKKKITKDDCQQKSSFSASSTSSSATTSSFESSEEFFQDDEEDESCSRKKIKVGNVFLDRIIGTDANV
ncbi:hypothetical protein C9374_010193 [Naegleria lovaniensis]|uniref:C2H2-type domain-containing protein n=1 Tax=Naegleria lovaniensis TaxID=51637 RepID=A0AA88GH52_NAELO|nr:uncharacterized protein C9374_010193 [Naegleria lovaniensis]KAG2375189.1 hypothetical protein C9374_010193 [Naegleria lovaniensis]